MARYRSQSQSQQLIEEYYIGLMSGTSIDAVDGVLAKITYMAAVNDFVMHEIKIMTQASLPFTAEMRQKILSLQSPQNNEIHLAQLVANQLVLDYYAPCVDHLIKKTATLGIANLEAKDIQAVAVHGQTIRHQPQMHDGWGYTLQLNQPALLAALLDIPVVADFRVADLYQKGQAAPLVPAFHAQLHALNILKNHGASTNISNDINNDINNDISIFCNIGGMSNISVMTSTQILGFDCGPGNVLLDAWIEHCLAKSYDYNGEWAANGKINDDLLKAFLQAPYFQQPFPKSTGRELFNLDFILHQTHKNKFKDLPPCDVQSTLVELTGIGIAAAINQALLQIQQIQHNHIQKNNDINIYICGGGAFNPYLLKRLAQHLAQYSPNFKIKTTLEMPISIPPQDMEALAFAWLGFMRKHQQKIDLTAITGSQKPVLLGVVYL